MSNLEVMGKLVDVDNHEKEVGNAFGDRDVAWKTFQTVADRVKFLLVGLTCRV